MPTDTAFSVSCFWKMKKRMMGGIIEKTTERIIVSALTVCSVLKTNRRTITVCSALPELYKIKPLLCHDNLRVLIIPVDVVDYRSLTGWSADKKRGSTRMERIPVSFGDAVTLDHAGDYRKLIPAALAEPFTAAAFGSQAKLNSRNTWYALSLLTDCLLYTSPSPRDRG